MRIELETISLARGMDCELRDLETSDKGINIKTT